jgi:ADP-ribosylation factor protein 1
MFKKRLRKTDCPRVLMTGLDAAGRTTILYKLKMGEIVTTIPTIGFNTEAIEYGGLTWRMYDIGGCDKIRVLAKHYYTDSTVFVYVVDSNDLHRFGEARDELHRMLGHELVDRHAPLLVWANKQDLPNARSVTEVADRLDLHSIRGRAWHIEESCATSGEGLEEGLDWLLAELGKTWRHTWSVPPLPDTRALCRQRQLLAFVRGAVASWPTAM